jgi:hypothetical protein
MDKRTTSILLIALTSVFCGLPGLAGLCIGPLAILGSRLPDSNLPTEEARIVLIIGVLLVFFSLVLVGIPIVAGFFTLGRGKKKPKLIEGTIPEEDF